MSSSSMEEQAAREAQASEEEHRRRLANRQRLRELRIKRLRAKVQALCLYVLLVYQLLLICSLLDGVGWVCVREAKCHALALSWPDWSCSGNRNSRGPRLFPREKRHKTFSKQNKRESEHTRPFNCSIHISGICTSDL